MNYGNINLFLHPFIIVFISILALLLLLVPYLIYKIFKLRQQSQAIYAALRNCDIAILQYSHARDNPKLYGAEFVKSQAKDIIFINKKDSCAILCQEKLELLLQKGENFTHNYDLPQASLYLKGARAAGQAYLCLLYEKSHIAPQYSLFDDFPLAIYIKDENNKLYYSNKAAHSILTPNIFACDSEYARAMLSGEMHSFRLDKIALANNHKLILAQDITKEACQAHKQQKIVGAYQEILDALPIAVSIFNQAKQLIFYNKAFLLLFEFNSAFLESKPNHANILEQLRLSGKLVDSPQWPHFRQEILDSYCNIDNYQAKWNLEDSRTLQIHTMHLPDGGMCWIYENLTEYLNLEAKYNNVIECQAVTLNNLLEGIALFESNGKIALSNPSFTGLWEIDLLYGQEKTHISDIIAQFSKKTAQIDKLKVIAEKICGFNEIREIKNGQIELKNGRVLEYSLCPAIFGQTILIFSDITSKIIAQRALEKKNQAIVEIDKLRDQFVRHIGYELLTPLTNIKGFTDLAQKISLKSNGVSLDKYLCYIAQESNKLQNMINDMLNLASLIAGIVPMQLHALDLRDVWQKAKEDNLNLLNINNVKLQLKCHSMNLKYKSDFKLLWQLLSNLISYVLFYGKSDNSIDLEILCTEEELIFRLDNLNLTEYKMLSFAYNNIKLSLAKNICLLYQGKLILEDNNLNIKSIICHLPYSDKLQRL